MKIKNDFVLRRLADLNLVMPAGENINTYKGALLLNDTAALIYECLAEGLDKQAILNRMTDEYNVSAAEAMGDIDETFALLVEGGVAE